MDEEDNLTDPFDPTDLPPDNDADFISDLNDPDDDNDGALDVDDEFPLDSRWVSWRGSIKYANEDTTILEGVQDGVIDPNDDPSILVLNGREDYELAQEIQEIHQDINDMTTPITLSQLDAQWEEIRDHQAGKVVTDRHGDTVRCASYVMLPTSDTVAVAFLNHRRDGGHAGVSSLTFEVAFVRNVDGQLIPADLSNVDLKTLPWDNYIDPPSGGNAPDTAAIAYDSSPAYYPRPGTDGPAFTLTARNGFGDYVKIFEAVGEISEFEINDGVGYYQNELALDYGVDLNGRLMNTTAGNVYGSPYSHNGGNWILKTNFREESAWYKMNAQLIDDNGTIQNADVLLDGSSEPLDIGSIRDFIEPSRIYNLELGLTSSEFSGRSIDVVITPEVGRPYTQED